MTTAREEIYSQVTEQIIADLEAGTIPWEKPWVGGFSLPRNASTQNSYNGINILILWMRQKKACFTSSQWITFNQARELGGSVKKGEKATRILFYKPLKVGEQSETGELEEKTIPMLKTHPVFNLSQVEGLESLQQIECKTASRNEPEVCQEAETILAKCGAQLSFNGGLEAFYNPLSDSIHMPEKMRFNDQLGYYKTLLHELVHWTGAKSRLDRNLGTQGRAHYAQEELIAELGSSFLCAHVGLKYTSQHASYIESWLKVLREDKAAIFKAASQARIATEFLTQTNH